MSLSLRAKWLSPRAGLSGQHGAAEVQKPTGASLHGPRISTPEPRVTLPPAAASQGAEL